MGFIADRYAYSPDEIVLAGSETQMLADLAVETQDLDVEDTDVA